MELWDLVYAQGQWFWKNPYIALLQGILTGILFLWYIRSFEDQDRDLRAALAVKGAFLALMSGMHLLYLPVIWHCLAMLGLLFLVMRLLSRVRWQNLCVECLIYCLMMELCKLICKDGVLTVFLMRMIPGLPEIAFQSIMLICYLLLLAGGTVILRRHQGRRRFLQLSGVQLSCLLFPFFLYLYVREVQFSCLNLGSWKLWLQMEGILVAEAVCAELVMMMTGSMLSVQNERNELLKREMLLREKQQQYQMQKEAIEAINRKYHDLKHYLTGLEAMNSEELDEYVQAMKREIEPYERMQETGNEIMDVLLNERIRECQEKGIRLVPFVDGRGLGFIRPLDLCAIFGNAMDNAIEATANLTYVNMREISVKIGASAGWLVMRFQNYFEGEIHRRGDRILTSKEDARDHGYGLENIRMLAEKYGGTMACEISGTEFALHVLIPIPEEEK